MEKIRVLVVDDSPLFRHFLAQGLAGDPRIEVVAVAGDPFEARDKILTYRPDVMTLDVEMPRMNGIEFLRRLMPQYPQATIVISAVDESVFEAIQLGAVDFISKPDGRSAKANQEFLTELIAKVKTTALAQVRQGERPQAAAVRPAAAASFKKRLICIGASTGGTVALTEVLTALHPPLPGILVVQHIPPVFSDLFAKRLDTVTDFSVKEAADGDTVRPGCVLIAPGDRHMQLIAAGGEMRVRCFSGDKVNGHCPSVDVLFDSAVKLGADAVGVILTGMGYDGAKGLLNMRRAGARTIGQDEASSVVYGMPRVAYNIGAVEIQAPLGRIAAEICRVL